MARGIQKAQQRLNFHLDEIEGKLEQVAELLEAQFNTDEDADWAMVGSAEKVSQDLSEIIAFLGGYETGGFER